MRLPTTLLTLLAFALTTIVASPFNLLAQRQAPNPSFYHDPFSQTASYNLTVFVLKIDKGSAQKLARGRKLLPVQGLPAGYLGEDEHPIIFLTGLLYDIRQIILNIKQLFAANIMVPFVDGSEDGETPFVFNSLIVQDQIVPVIAGALQQSINLQVANFHPHDKAWKNLDNDLYSQNIDQGLDVNLLGIPLPNTPLINAVWKPVDAKDAKVSSQFLKGVIDAPYIHTYSGLCSKTTYDYGQIFAQPFFVEGDIEIFPPGIPQYKKFRNVAGYHVATGWDNEFGPGKKCEEYRDFAKSVMYS
ncbi:unnamed protein product [Sympodiomycopsis kandeliae]